jgi:hypothetical protein
MYAPTPAGGEIIADRREMLRVKVKSLAEEARIIRREEQRTHGQLRNELHHHRVLVVRREARYANIAYALVKGRTYEQIEGNAKTPPSWESVKRMLKTYGPIGWESLLPKEAQKKE